MESVAVRLLSISLCFGRSASHWQSAASCFAIICQEELILQCHRCRLRWLWQHIAWLHTDQFQQQRFQDQYWWLCRRRRGRGRQSAADCQSGGVAAADSPGCGHASTTLRTCAGPAAGGHADADDIAYHRLLVCQVCIKHVGLGHLPRNLFGSCLDFSNNLFDILFFSPPVCGTSMLRSTFPSSRRNPFCRRRSASSTSASVSSCTRMWLSTTLCWGLLLCWLCWRTCSPRCVVCCIDAHRFACRWTRSARCAVGSWAHVWPSVTRRLRALASGWCC